MFNGVRVGVVVAFAALGCGGKAAGGGNGTGDGNAMIGAPSAAGGAVSTDPGASLSQCGAPAYGNYSVAGSDGLTGDAGAVGYIVGGSGGLTGDAGGVGYSVGGFGGLTGDAGAVGVNSDCSTPPLSPPLLAWAPGTLPDEPVSQLLTDARSKLTGNWRGVVSSPFVPPYSIVMSFGADGGYSAHCTAHSDYDGSSPGCCRALYYGTDQDSSLKQWTLATADANGKTSGKIDVIFSYSGQFGESSYQGKISELELDATGNRARFNFLYGDRMAGTYDLERTP